MVFREAYSNCAVKPEITAHESAAAMEVAQQMRVAIFIVAYNAEAQIRETLRRIPKLLLPYIASIYVFDDSSSDATTAKAQELIDEIPQLRVFSTPSNQGYGGNQKLGYQYASQAEYDIVVLLHGDGQYAPEVLPRLLAPFTEDDVAAVFGSRMMIPGASRRGGMPFYKRVGNHILTGLGNRLLNANLTEFHSGYRAYRVRTLAELPYRYNTNDFHFDTEVIIQLLGQQRRIVEVPIPTYYGDEICHVNGIAYAWNCLMTMLRYRANLMYLMYHPKFDLEPGRTSYQYKEARTSLHQHVLALDFKAGSKVVELGAGTGDISSELHRRGVDVLAVDRYRPAGELPFEFLEEDLDAAFHAAVNEKLGGSADTVIALDMIEHLRNPEEGVRALQHILRPGGRLIVSTGNIAYITQRLALLLGQFNYGKRGILDLTHTRLFTIRSKARVFASRMCAVSDRRSRT